MKNKKDKKISVLLIALILLAVLLVFLILFLLFKQNRILKQSDRTGNQQAQLADSSVAGPFQEDQEESGFISHTSNSRDDFYGPQKSDSDDSSSTQSNSVTDSSNDSSTEVMGPVEPSQTLSPTSKPDQNSSDEAEEEQDVESLARTPDSATSEEGTISPSHGSSAFDDRSDETLDTIITQVKSALPAGNGSWSVYICDLSSGAESTINDFSMQAASLIKLYIMGAVYENYDALSQQYGADTLDSNLTSMITVSDNDAANRLVSCLGNGDSSAGMQKVNTFCQTHGYSNTSMGRLLLASKESGDNYTSAHDCGKFLKEVYQICAGTTQTPSLTHAPEMYALLKQQQRTNKIPAALPEGVHVANKTGELSDVENDAGILYDTARGNDLVICFLSENLSSAGDAQNTIAQLSKTIYLAYNS